MDLYHCSPFHPQILNYLNSQKCFPSALKASLIYKISAENFVVHRCIILRTYYIHYDGRFVIFLWRTWYLNIDYLQLCIRGSTSNKQETSICHHSAQTVVGNYSHSYSMSIIASSPGDKGAKGWILKLTT
jgi:hypothetical protein